MTKKEDIIGKAQETVGARGDSYGTPYTNFSRIAELWSCHLERDITVYDVGVLFILAKVARSKEDMNHDDTWIDIAGYAGAVSEAIEDDNKKFK
jgi:hypothetical protein|tara:strand:- start:359 stop:640 length:282 start_codon:yes stop_codon:yes gene_type:complete